MYIQIIIIAGLMPPEPGPGRYEDEARAGSEARAEQFYFPLFLWVLNENFIVGTSNILLYYPFVVGR